jgi:hypothetical protein
LIGTKFIDRLRVIGIVLACLDEGFEELWANQLHSVAASLENP